MLPIAALLPLVDAALALIEKAVPHIQAAFASGEVSVEEQQKLHDRFEKLKASGFKFDR